MTARMVMHPLMMHQRKVSASAQCGHQWSRTHTVVICNDCHAGDDDGPPPIPSGWERVELGQPFKHFLLWTRLAKNARAMWHLMTVVQVLAPGRKDKYTHDAHLQSESATKKRGVELSPAMHESASEDGIWVGISKVGEEVSLPPPQ